MDLSAAFRSLVRKIVGMPADEGQPPQIDRLANYRARVDVCTADGSKVDVTPEDTRIPAKKNVPLRTPAGYVAVLQPGAIVWVGWDRGDPAKMHALPVFESATCAKIQIGAQAIEVGGNTYSLPQWDSAAIAIKAFATAAKASVTDPTLVTAATALELAFTAANNFKSTIVKNG